MKYLIYSEVQNNNVKSVTLEILGRLRQKISEVDVAVIGKVGDAGIAKLKEFGANKVFELSSAATAAYSSDAYAGTLHQFVKQNSYDYVFAGSTSGGKDFFPRLAAMFDSGMVSEVIDFNFEGEQFVGKRPLFAGKCLANVQLLGPRPYFVTVRPNALGLPANKTAGNAQQVPTSVDAKAALASVKEVIKGKSEKLDLTEANFIVSGGRAMKNSENFVILNELADVIGATVGASRAAVDSGYAHPSMQVGQTGKTVSPSLYIACGISGAIQHLAGMRTSKIIVAVNTDPDAPIFSKADYGIVGDLFKVVPSLTKEFKKLLGK